MDQIDEVICVLKVLKSKFALPVLGSIHCKITYDIFEFLGVILLIYLLLQDFVSLYRFVYIFHMLIYLQSSF